MTTADPRSTGNTLSIDRSTFFWAYFSLLAAALVGYIWNARPNMSPNDASRWDTVWSLVEYQTYEIFDTESAGPKQQFLTIDKVVRRHDKKTVSSKPPLLPTVIAGFVYAVKPVVGLPITKDEPVPGRPLNPGSINIYAKLVLWVFQVVPLLVALVLFRRFLDRYAQTDLAWTLCLLTAGLGTLVTGYIVTLNNHVVAATSALIACYHVLRIADDGRREGWRFALVGLLAAWTAANELPAALFAAVVTLVLLVIDPRRTIVAYLPAAILVTAAFFTTNYLAIGDPAQPADMRNFIPAYLQKDLYQADADGQPSYWARKDKSGIDALNDHPEPIPIYVLHSLVGHHGVITLSPILLFAWWGMAGQAIAGTRVWRTFALLSMAVSAVVFAFYVFISDQRNYGGFCHGLRWVIWMSLVWLYFLPACLDRWGSRRWVAGAGWAALVVSVLSVFDTWYNPWTRSWWHRILRFVGVIDY